MSPTCAPTTIATIGIDLGKNTFHLVGLDSRGAIVLQLKLSRGQIERRLANVPCCLIGMEACSGAHHVGRRLTMLGHDVRPSGLRERLRFVGHRVNPLLTVLRPNPEIKESGIAVALTA